MTIFLKDVRHAVAETAVRRKTLRAGQASRLHAGAGGEPRDARAADGDRRDRRRSVVRSQSLNDLNRALHEQLAPGRALYTMPPRRLVGVDAGGTFTDIVAISEEGHLGGLRCPPLRAARSRR